MRVHGWFARCVWGVALCAFPMALSAQEFSDGVRPAGMGDAFTAISSGTSAIYHNPAGTASAVMYSVDGIYEYTPTGNVLNLSLVDSKTNPKLAAGIGYSYYFARGDSNRRGHDIRLGIGVPIVPDRISVGIGGRWLIVNDTVPVQNEAGEVVETDVKLMNGPTLDAGAMVKITPEFSLGVAARNLIEQCDRVECRPIAPTQIQVGAAFSSSVGLTLAADGGVDLTSGEDVGFDVGVGAEFLIAGVVPVRAGYERKGVAEINWLTFGAGWRSQAAGFDLGYQLNLEQTEDMHFMGSISVYF